MKFQNIIIIALALSVSACEHEVSPDKIINHSASVPPAFGISKLGVIASSINKRKHTMSTLYGNSNSVNRTRAGAALGTGEKLVLVTWKQKADESWFGANIPDEIQSIEQISAGGDVKEMHYQQFLGQNLTLNQDTSGRSRRISNILGMQASIMP